MPRKKKKASKATKPTTGRRSKYRNVRTEVEGITFDSKREAHQYQDLQLCIRAGVVRNLRLQVPFELKAEGGKTVGKYVADFVYEELIDGQWVEIIRDCKGYRTELYRWKCRHMKAQYGIEILET